MASERKEPLMEFMKTFKKAAELGLFADPIKLNELVPMSVEWQERAAMSGSPWTDAKRVALRSSLFSNATLRYSIREANGWGFYFEDVKQIACISFDEAVALWGKEYQLAPKPDIRYSPGSAIPRVGPQKMAGEGIIYQLDSSIEQLRTVGLRMSFDGCVDYFVTHQEPKSVTN